MAKGNAAAGLALDTARGWHHLRGVEQSPSGPTGARRTVSVTGSFLGTLRWSPVGSQRCTVSQRSRPVLRETQLHVLRASLSTVVCPGRVSAAPVPHGGAWLFTPAGTSLHLPVLPSPALRPGRPPAWALCLWGASVLQMVPCVLFCSARLIWYAYLTV